MHTIMIVDNEPFELTLLEQMLQADDYRFETAFTATEAKELLRNLGRDTTAILMDWVLPDDDGMELLGWIKAQPFTQGIEVIVHSEAFSSDNVQKAIECGAYYYLTKPYDEPQLEAIVRAAVGSAEMKRELERQAREARGAVRLLDRGVFHFKTRDEAELLAVHLTSACGQDELILGLRELLVNAVEHGNLGITYDEKGKLLEEGKLADECQKRLTLPEYMDRRVEVRLSRGRGSIKVTIRDEGQGFDFEKYKTIDEERLFHSHGRGVLMASATLDLEYVAPGNKVAIRLPVSA